jgi:hypothetical protein
MTLKELVESEKRRIAAGEPEPVPQRRSSFVARTGSRPGCLGPAVGVRLRPALTGGCFG